jgi:tetratricopeptide (TPR) repeat protein
MTAQQTNQQSQGPLETARNLCMDGIALGKEGKKEEALNRYAAVLAQFGKRRSFDFLKVIATAMFNMGNTLAGLERNEEAVAAYELLIKKLRQDNDSRLEIYLVKAFMNKAYRLNILMKNDESIATYKTLVTQYETNKDPEILSHIITVKSFLAERQAALNARQ